MTGISIIVEPSSYDIIVKGLATNNGGGRRRQAAGLVFGFWFCLVLVLVLFAFAHAVLCVVDRLLRKESADLRDVTGVVLDTYVGTRHMYCRNSNSSTYLQVPT
jgi:hypothetical protein